MVTSDDENSDGGGEGDGKHANAADGQQESPAAAPVTATMSAEKKEELFQQLWRERQNQQVVGQGQSTGSATGDVVPGVSKPRANGNNHSGGDMTPPPQHRQLGDGLDAGKKQSTTPQPRVERQCFEGAMYDDCCDLLSKLTAANAASVRIGEFLVMQLCHNKKTAELLNYRECRAVANKCLEEVFESASTTTDYRVIKVEVWECASDLLSRNVQQCCRPLNFALKLVSVADVVKLGNGVRKLNARAKQATDKSNHAAASEWSSMAAATNRRIRMMRQHPSAANKTQRSVNACSVYDDDSRTSGREMRNKRRAGGVTKRQRDGDSGYRAGSGAGYGSDSDNSSTTGGFMMGMKRSVGGSGYSPGSGAGSGSGYGCGSSINDDSSTTGGREKRRKTSVGGSGHGAGSGAGYDNDYGCGSNDESIRVRAMLDSILRAHKTMIETHFLRYMHGDFSSQRNNAAARRHATAAAAKPRGRKINHSWSPLELQALAFGSRIYKDTKSRWVSILHDEHRTGVGKVLQERDNKQLKGAFKNHFTKDGVQGDGKIKQYSNTFEQTEFCNASLNTSFDVDSEDGEEEYRDQNPKEYRDQDPKEYCEPDPTEFREHEHNWEQSYFSD